MSDLPVRTPDGQPPGIIDGAPLNLRPLGGVNPIIASQGDALAAPAADDLAPTLYAMLPTGAAWRTPDATAFAAESRLGRFWRAVAFPLAELYARIFGVSQESTAVTLAYSLDEWEIEYGLPDECLALDRDDDSSFVPYQTRLAWLIRKIRHEPVITPADFVELARLVGYEISIDEPNPWIAGGSQCGDERFPLGGTDRVEFYWIVRAVTPGVEEFHAGAGIAGETPLGRIRRLQALECLFRRIAPAWTMPVFHYSET